MDWEIQEVSKDCLNCHERFCDKDDFYTFLALSAEGHPQRSDFCHKCFDVLKSSWLLRSDLVSQWKGTLRTKRVQPKAKPLPYERIELLLRKYMIGEEERDRKFSYILALMLERKKILLYRESVVQDLAKKFLVYEHRDTGECFTLEDPRLELGQLGDVQRELKSVMDAEFQVEIA